MVLPCHQQSYLFTGNHAMLQNLHGLSWFWLWSCVLSKLEIASNKTWNSNSIFHNHSVVNSTLLNGTCTYVSEPQLRVWDFSLSLWDLLELRRALNFPRRACHLQIKTGCPIKNHESHWIPPRCRHAHSFRILSWNFPSQPRFFFHHLVCPSIWRI